jgi:hypothetical protein
MSSCLRGGARDLRSSTGHDDQCMSRRMLATVQLPRPIARAARAKSTEQFTKDQQLKGQIP